MKRNILVLIVIVIAIIAVAGVGYFTIQKPATSAIKVALVLSSPAGDYGWSYNAYSALMGLKDLYGKEIEVSYTESVTVGDAPRVIREYAAAGYDLIIAHGYGYMDPIIEVGASYPNTKFFLGGGEYKQVTYMNAYSSLKSETEGSYLMGMIAGLMTKTNKVGVVASIPSPPIIAPSEGFKLGVEYVNPNVEVRRVWTGSWYDPVAEKDQALAVLDLGADMIYHITDSPAPSEAAQARGAYAFSANGSDMRKLAPNTYLACWTWDLPTLFKSQVDAIKAGTWVGGKLYDLGISEGQTVLTPLPNSVPQNVKDAVNKRIQEFASGAFKVPIMENQTY